MKRMKLMESLSFSTKCGCNRQICDTTSADCTCGMFPRLTSGLQLVSLTWLTLYHDKCSEFTETAGI